MGQHENSFGREHLRRVRHRMRGLLVNAAIFSVFVNLLLLTAPIYMLQIYDRVLSSGSVATLVTLSLLMAFLFLMMGCLDYARGRLLARAGARFQAELDERAFQLDLAVDPPQPQQQQSAPKGTIQNIDSIRRLLASPVMSAMFDLPWTPVFLLAITLFHPWLGALALSGGAVLIGAALLNQWLTRGPVAASLAHSRKADLLAGRLQTEGQMIRALGFTAGTGWRWQKLRQVALGAALCVSDQQSLFAVMTKTFRQFLQSAMLGLGAYLALQGEMSPGAMIAGSILLSRALGPVDVIVGQWPIAQRAQAAWRTLAADLSITQPTAAKTTLPRPAANVQLAHVTVIPAGQSFAVLQNISFSLHPGTALGVIGPSGAGKSTLARVLTGALRPTAGSVRLDGAALHQYDPAQLGHAIGYLPQRVVFFDGTVAENIAGFRPDTDDADIVAAARAAGAHEVILSLPDGYDTMVTPGMTPISGGQLQRISLARALFGDPPLVVLDEPNSNLDHDGSHALSLAIQAVKNRGGAVVIMAHRPSVIQHCDQLMVLERGRITDFGPREEILRKTVRSAPQHHALYSIEQGGDGHA
ncbi:protease/lipase ABC transporter permease/ATP-binding protein [Aliiroseovarius zhejiangensis]|uniref:Protease/lipase ABC transporter permease/ATP-binding protein n=1 Tax=Aliiroseovarius zhejiangensis TaxID=1632025 RepID=A0ABQ3JB22_9RHOB|nr:type I secretion system permease/ATPase [Aliiroseovarius zhejiangensis]GHF08658.1 protease/lipase ABC transporter permease/ATP-binding protein [Aliiroseovarius zhejiangensis]